MEPGLFVVCWRNMNTEPLPVSVESVNRSDWETFIKTIGNVIEHCPLCAAAIWPERPFRDVRQLHQAICSFIDQLPDSGRMGILRLHPDLAGRLSKLGQLTAESQAEQKAAGLDKLTSQQVQTMEACNEKYKEKFGFPFVICARENKSEAILEGIQRRLENEMDKEMRTGIEEVKKIAYLRLRAILEDGRPEVS